MSEEKSLIDISNTDNIVKLIQSPVKLAEVITGILVSDVKDWKLSAGKLIQAAIKFKFLSQLGKELKEYAQKGQIKEDYFTTHKEQAALHELLKFIDEEVPDEERFKAMKSIFLYSITENISKKDEELSYELIKVCKRISSGGLLVLKACYEIVNNNISFDYNGAIDLSIHSAAEWFNIVAKQIGHNMPSLVELYEDELFGLRLISSRTLPDRSGIGKTKYFRLTELGFKLCDFISKYP